MRPRQLSMCAPLQGEGNHEAHDGRCSRCIGTCIEQAIKNVCSEINMLNLHREVEGSGPVDSVYGVHITVFMRKNVLKDIGGAVAHTEPGLKARKGHDVEHIFIGRMER